MKTIVTEVKDGSVTFEDHEEVWTCPHSGHRTCKREDYRGVQMEEVEESSYVCQGCNQLIIRHQRVVREKTFFLNSLSGESYIFYFNKKGEAVQCFSGNGSAWWYSEKDFPSLDEYLLAKFTRTLSKPLKETRKRAEGE